MYFFLPFVRPCMHHNYSGISESHVCKDWVWLIIFDAGLHTVFPGERVLVVMTHHVQSSAQLYWSSSRLQPLQNYDLIKFAIIRPSTINHDRNLWNCRGAPDETTCLTVFFGTFEAVSRKNMYLFLERCRRSNNAMVGCFDAVRLFISFLVLWKLQPHFTLWLSAPNIAVFVRLRVCLSQCIRTLTGLDQFRN